jgi:hypothetical protein
MQVVHIVTTLWWVGGFFLAVYTKIADVVVKVCSVFFPAAPATTVRCSKHVTSASVQKRYAGLSANCPMLAPDFKQNWKLSTVFSRSSQYQIT